MDQDNVIKALSNQDRILTALFNKVVDIEENMVTKEEFNQKTDDLMTHIDGFVKLHQTLDIELVAMRDKYNRLETRLVRLEQKFGMAV